jgi:TolB-like protein/Tfp pilus assembly protein PilF
MKRCPECRRDYYDDTLLYCLDDGNALLEGPRSEPPASAGGQFGDEPQTAILHSTAAPGEAPTRAQINTTDATAILRNGAEAEPRESLGGLSERQSLSANRAAKPLVALIVVVLVLVGGFFGYRYFSQTKQIESIAVMPFVNDSGNVDVEYLSDGMTETLIASLSKLPNLNVKARSSVFRYKGKATDAKTIGSELGVQAILNGRIAQRGDQLTLSLELIDAQTENVIWSDKYDRKQSDVLTLQTEIARDVSSKLKSRVSGAEVAKVEKTYTANPEAYELYLKGLFEYNKATSKSLKQAAEFYKLAIEKDPNYAEAHAGLAIAYLNFSNYSVAPPKESMPLAKAAALRALELDDSLSRAHVALARYRSEFEWDRVGAENEIRRAIELEPNDSRLHGFLSHMLAQQKRFDEAIAAGSRAQQLDPLSVTRNLFFAERLADARRYDEAIAQLLSVLERDPNFANAHWSLGWTYFGKGMYQESITSFQRAFDLDPDPVIKGYNALSYAKLGQRDEALKQLEWLKQESPKRYVPSISLAFAYLALDQRDEAFVWLEREAEERTIFASSYAIEPALDELRGEPRFKAMLKRMNLPE